MWHTQRVLGTCLRRSARPAAAAGVATPLRLRASVASSDAAAGPVCLHYTCRLLRSICAQSQSEEVKHRRLRGAVLRLESSVVDSFSAAMAPLAAGERRELMLRWLRSMASATRYLHRQEASSFMEADGVEVGRFSPRAPRHARHDTDDGETWSGASPYFSLATSDLLCLCVRECAMADARTDHATLRELLGCAVQLELGDVEVLQHIVHALTKADACRNQSPSEQVQLLCHVSLAVKRCKLPTPPLDRVLCVLPRATLNARESLQVLSSLHRLKHAHAIDVVASVSRKAARQAEEYNGKDVVFALEAAALLPGCSDVFVGCVLRRTGTLAATMTSQQLGAVCKYVALLNPSRHQNTLAHSCGAELRCLLPLLVERAETLVGTLSMNEARYVLRCLREHKVRHSLLFSRLTPVTEDT
ncbi:hypothetical protein NESM_000654100 [Novymonas esmeraldas]|uniref:Uncharacterized protein n=1 Tax=Novymonas esmeraldas TaxID=1808958 RepID=A0AAW0EUB5_9TRYP